MNPSNAVAVVRRSPISWRASRTSTVQVAGWVVMALVLSACNRTPSKPPAPMIAPAQIPTAPTTAGASVTSVPDAGSVVTP